MLSDEEKKYYHKINNLDIALEETNHKYIMIHQWSKDKSHKWGIAVFNYDKDEYYWYLRTYGNFTPNIDWYDFGCLVNLGYKWIKELGWNDEEKKELQELINLLYNGHISQYGKRKLEAYIKKQQKEIEKLKQKEKEAYNFGYRNGCNDTSKFNDKTFIRIDKIKAKINECEKEKNIPEEMDFKAFYRIKDLKNIEIAVLQSLLEKE